MPSIKQMLNNAADKLTGSYWTLETAMPLILQLQAAVRDIGYHVALGGGVLNKGKSNKYLDLYILPLNDIDAGGYSAVRTEIRKILDYKGDIKTDPDYSQGSGRCRGCRGGYMNSAMDESSVYEWKGKRVDVFIITCRASLVANRLLNQ